MHAAGLPQRAAVPEMAVSGGFRRRGNAAGRRIAPGARPLPTDEMPPLTDSTGHVSNRANAEFDS